MYLSSSLVAGKAVPGRHICRWACSDWRTPLPDPNSPRGITFSVLLCAGGLVLHTVATSISCAFTHIRHHAPAPSFHPYLNHLSFLFSRAIFLALCWPSALGWEHCPYSACLWGPRPPRASLCFGC
ncbi:unnamed protein product [Rangifer tarandus platyrhynchus]|uniref:Uncharacterized protein n=1 Tax=Rangifer tarandus platyrhynchus TaxID=3082113 RepID=A0ACB1KDK1_RANTA